MLLEESSINGRPDLVATVEESGEEETFGVDDRDIEEEEEEEEVEEEVDEEETNGKEGDEVDASEEEECFLSQPVRKPRKALKRLSTTAPVNQKSTSTINLNTVSLAISQTLSSSSSQVYISFYNNLYKLYNFYKLLCPGSLAPRCDGRRRKEAVKMPFLSQNVDQVIMVTFNFIEKCSWSTCTWSLSLKSLFNVLPHL